MGQALEPAETQGLPLAISQRGNGRLRNRQQLRINDLRLGRRRPGAGENIMQIADLGGRPPLLGIARFEVVQREIAQGGEQERSQLANPLVGIGPPHRQESILHEVFSIRDVAYTYPAESQELVILKTKDIVERRATL